jgi:DNA-binding NarL/FixJ family response regulator
MSATVGHARSSPGPARGLGRAALLVVPALFAGNLVSYLFTVVVARQLGPAAYGALGGLLAIVIALAVPGMALQLVVARNVAVCRRDGVAAGSLQAAVIRLGLRAGVALAVPALAAAPLLSGYLHLGSPGPPAWLAVNLALLPLLFAVSGLLQGRERFGVLTAVLLLVAAGKLPLGVALVAAGYGVEGALAGVAVGTLAAVLLGVAACGRARHRPGPAAADPEGSGEPRRGAPVGREGSGEPRRGAPVGREGLGAPRGGSPRIEVVLADDEALIRTGLRAIIDAEPDLAVTGEAADGAEVVPLVRRLRPDVVLMDVRMPAVDGIQATRHLVETLADPPKVLVVTTFENDDHVYDALRAGASGFLLKRARPAELVQAIRTVAAGESLLFPAAIRRLAARRADRPAAGRLAGAQLTDREAEVLALMAKGLSNAEIAGRLAVSLQTVKTHVANVLAKLQARDRTQAVIAAYDSGFVTPG